jgi:hypothetical protein
MTFPKCEDGYNRRKLTDFAKGVVDDLKGIGKFFNPPRTHVIYLPPNLIEHVGAISTDYNWLTVFPYIMTFPFRCVGAAARIAVTHPCNLEFALYDSDETGYPNRLLRHKSFSIPYGGGYEEEWDPIDLEAGIYWAGIVNYTESETYPRIGVYSRPLFPRHTVLGEIGSQEYFMCETPNGVLPDPFPSEADPGDTAITGVFLRISQG